jgi:hypothetical protein
MGYMLIDTGATGTCIALDVAQEMGLTPIRLTQSYGAHGLQENPIFFAHLDVVFDAPGKAATAITGDRDVTGVKDLHKFIDHMQIKPTPGFPHRLIGLLGRDWLRHGTLLYEGSKGRFEFKLDFASLVPDPPPAN